MGKKKLHIAVVMGGRTAEHEISIATGEMIVNNLDRSKYSITPVIINRDGGWLIHHKINKKQRWEFRQYKRGYLPAGRGIDRLTRKNFDAVFIAMHGPFGEDGTIQGLLEMLDIPYTGSDVCASALAMDKVRAKEIYRSNGIPTPRSIVVDSVDWKETRARVVSAIKNRIGLPCFIKPARLGSSVGLNLCRRERELSKCLRLALKYDGRALVEEFIKGREVTCAVLDTPGGKAPVALPPTEIVPLTRSYFDYHAKYTPGATSEVTPAPIGKWAIKKVREASLRAHAALGCSGMSRTDMILKGGTPYVLETNTIPGMTGTSLLPQAARASGLSFPALLDRIITVSLERHRKRKKLRNNRWCNASVT